MTFRTRMAGHVSTVFLNTDHFAESVTYTPNGGSGSTVSALIDRQRMDISYGSDGEMESISAPVSVAMSDVSEPARQDTLSFPIKRDGDTDVTWVIDTMESVDQMWVLSVVYMVHSEYSPEGYRARRI